MHQIVNEVFNSIFKFINFISSDTRNIFFHVLPIRNNLTSFFFSITNYNYYISLYILLCQHLTTDQSVAAAACFRIHQQHAAAAACASLFRCLLYSFCFSVGKRALNPLPFSYATGIHTDVGESVYSHNMNLNMIM